MTTTIFEETPENTKRSEGAMGDAKKSVEKQARQLAYDIRYEIKKQTGDKPLDPASLKREYMKGLQKSSQPPAIKLRAKQMLLGEDYISDVKDIVSETIANVMFKVFVEGVQKEIELDYLQELADKAETKYKVRVTDKKTGNSYVRYATREKISELRANPNISSVEMTEYGEPREGEKNKGEQTAAIKSGKTAKKDYDGDGKVESGAKEYRGAVHNAIQRKKGGVADGKDTSGVKEEFLGEIKNDKKTDKKGKITGEGVNNSSIIKVFPDDNATPSRHGMVVANSYELNGNIISEKAVSTAQQKFMGMVYAAKKGEKAASPEVAKAAAGMSEKEAKKFAKTKHKGLPVHKEESECGMDEKPKLKKSEGGELDSREIPTKVNLVKNKMRAMGLKMSYEPEGEMVDEGTKEAQERRFQKHGDRSEGETQTRLIGTATTSQDRMRERQRRVKPESPLGQKLKKRSESMDKKISKLQKARSADTSSFRQGPTDRSIKKD
jgi:hypothetical protein